MPAAKDNQYAAKPADEKHGDSFTLRAPSGLKGRAVRVAQARGVKLSPWLIQVISEAAEREEKELGLPPLR